MINSVHGIYINRKKVLMVTTKKGYDIFPGGKLKDLCEPHDSCLKREFKEELKNAEIFFGLKYKIFSGPIPNSNEELCSITYFCCPLGELKGVSEEITEFKFVDSSDKSKLNLTVVSRKTLDSLIKHKLKIKK